jgi:hypothetical protein
MADLQEGDYVLATKYGDGDPCDQFCVGFFAGMCRERYLVVDGDGKQFRHGGFRRCEKISRYVGETLVRAIPHIGDRSGRSLWYWRRHIKLLKAVNDYYINKYKRYQSGVRET